MPGSPYGSRTDPFTKIPGKFHSGQDFPAPAGTPVPTAASGGVVYSGFNDKLGNVVIVKNDTGDYSLYGHLQDGDRAKLGQRIWPADTIGLVGSTGERTRGPHLHYSIIGRDARSGVENPQLSHDSGPIGVALNEQNTMDPAGYDNYDSRPRYLGESQRAERMMSGLDDKATPREDLPFAPKQQFDIPFSTVTNLPAGNPRFVPGGTAPLPSPATQNPIADRSGKWGSVPLANTPAASDDSAGFNGRYVNWASWPADELGNFNAAPLHAPDLGKRSEADDDAPVRVLSSRVVNASPASGDAPTLGPESAQPLLGIYSGKPMRDYPVWPSIFATDDRSSPDDDELYQRWRRFLDA